MSTPPDPLFSGQTSSGENSGRKVASDTHAGDPRTFDDNAVPDSVSAEGGGEFAGDVASPGEDCLGESLLPETEEFFVRTAGASYAKRAMAELG
jgi:hypothetical protein